MVGLEMADDDGMGLGGGGSSMAGSMAMEGMTKMNEGMSKMMSGADSMSDKLKESMLGSMSMLGNFRK
jgi:hypothetical protein